MTFRSYVDDIVGLLDRDTDRVVMEDDLRTYTGGDFAALIRQLTAALGEHGVTHGQCVALVAPITATAVAARYAAARLGASTVFCPDAGSPERLAIFLSRIVATTLIVFPDTARAAAVGGDLRVLAVGEVDGIPDLLDADGPVDDDGADRDDGATVAGDDVCALVATGGTTGISKASVRTFDEYRRLVDLGPTPGRRQLVCTPLAYIAQTMVDTVLLGGGTAVLRAVFNPDVVIDAMEQAAITHVALVEPLVVELVDSDRLPTADLSSVQAISHVGADAAPALRARMVDRIGRSILVNPYGASEFGVVSALAGTDYTATSPHLASSGRPLPVAEVAIVADDDSHCAAGVVGRIRVRTRAQAHGYSVAPSTSGFGADGWFTTGDAGFLDESGYLTIRGRTADRREIDGGTWFPVDVQQALCAHGSVRYAVAVPAPDDAPAAFGAAVIAMPGSDLTVAQLVEFLTETAPHLAETPMVVVDSMPLTEQGKPHRAAVGALLF